MSYRCGYHWMHSRHGGLCIRIVVVQRSAHAGEVLHATDGATSLQWSVVESLDRHDVPNGLPFIVDDDGSLTGCD